MGRFIWLRGMDGYFCSHARNKFLCVALKIEPRLRRLWFEFR